MREYTTPAVIEPPTTGSLSDPVWANASSHPDTAVFSRRVASGDPNVRAEQKAVRLREWLGQPPTGSLVDAELWAYGNSSGDHELRHRPAEPAAGLAGVHVDGHVLARAGARDVEVAVGALDLAHHSGRAAAVA